MNRRWSNLFIRIVLAWLTLVAMQVLCGITIPISWPDPGRAFAWLLLTNILVVSVLGYVASRADLRGWGIGLASAAIPLSIASANLIEGAVFLKTAMPWGRIFLQTILTYVLVAPFWAWIFAHREAATAHFHPVESKRPASRAWRFLASDVSYLILYFVAGLIVFPLVRDFYATQALPTMGKLIALQLLVCGPIFVGICLLLVRLLGLTRLPGTLVVGLLFTVLSGVVPLLQPNPLFPDTVRWVHFVEVTASNFVFGVMVAWLWGPPSTQPHVLAKAA